MSKPKVKIIKGLKPIDELDNCPSCGTTWQGEFIIDMMKKQRDDEGDYLKGMTDEQLQEKMEEDYRPPYRYGLLIGVEIQGEFDGVSYWKCPECDTYWDRFTNEIATSFDKKS